MIGGNPSRIPQPVDRRPMQAQRSASRPSGDDPWSGNGSKGASQGQRAVPQPQPQVQATTKQDPPEKRSKRLLKILVPVAALIIVLAIAGSIWLSNRDSVSSMIDESKYQGIFFTNGQVYFGKLEIVNGDYMKLSNVFYIQSDTSVEGVGEEESVAADVNHKLIKRGAEVYGPEDTMVIDRDQVLFFENLKTDSEVSQLIKNYRSSNN